MAYLVSYQYPKVPHPATRGHFERLLGRAGFSGSAKQIDVYQKLGLEQSVLRMLAPAASPKMAGPAPKDNGSPIDPYNAWGHDCLWWLDRMVRSPNQGQERMTLNLHDHFATSNSGVGNTRHMLRQNRLLRSHAVGNFADLLHDITHDPAMLLWLNGADSNKWSANENYAREVMELFCLGNDPTLEEDTYGLWRNSHVYTQDDISEAARALTGWRYDWNKCQNGPPRSGRTRPSTTPAGTTRARRRSSARRATGAGKTCASWWSHTPTTRPTSATSYGATSSRRGHPRRRWR